MYFLPFQSRILEQGLGSNQYHLYGILRRPLQRKFIGVAFLLKNRQEMSASFWPEMPHDLMLTNRITHS